ncbi:hypothetical protein D3C81_2222010 [compost metagenome]
MSLMQAAGHIATRLQSLGPAFADLPYTQTGTALLQIMIIGIEIDIQLILFDRRTLRIFLEQRMFFEGWNILRLYQ